jgi:biopolymer transport protein ExbB
VFGYTIFLCSFVLIAVVMMLIMQLRRDVMLPSGFVETFEEHLNSKDIQGAYETAKGDDSTIGRMMAAGMAKLQQGPEKAMEELQSVGEEEYMFIDHKLGYLALIAAVAPMLGLLGTVQGMIVSFEEIARSPTTPKPKDLAVGISMALVTTLEGLVVAIPAMVANSLLKNKAQVLMNQIGATATGLMGRFAINNKAAAARPAGGAPAAGPAARAE